MDNIIIAISRQIIYDFLSIALVSLYYHLMYQKNAYNQLTKHIKFVKKIVLNHLNQYNQYTKSEIIIGIILSSLIIIVVGVQCEVEYNQSSLVIYAIQILIFYYYYGKYKNKIWIKLEEFIMNQFKLFIDFYASNGSSV